MGAGVDKAEKLEKRKLEFFVVFVFFVASAMGTVHGFNNHKDDPGDNDKFYDILDEVAIGNHGGVASTEEVWDG